MHNYKKILLLLLTVISSASGESKSSSMRLGGTDKETRLVVEFSGPFDFKILPQSVKNTITVALPNTQKTEKITTPHGLISAVELKPVDKATHLIVKIKPETALKGCFRLATSDKGKPFRLVMDLIPQQNIKTTLPPQTIVDIPHKPLKLPKTSDKTEAPITKTETTSLPLTPTIKKGHKPVIAIDPGHGGIDPGTIGIGGIKEKDVTLSMALELRKQLIATGRYQVILTRDQDVFLPLKARVAKARKGKADLFISLHADSHPNPDTKGLSVYTLSKNRQDKEAERLAARENKVDLIAGLDLSSESTEVTNILIDLAQRESMNMSSDFAKGLVESLEKDLLLPNRPHRLASFAVLTAPDIPSILIELGYLSNKEEARKLRQISYRQKLSVLLKNAVDGYYRNRLI